MRGACARVAKKPIACYNEGMNIPQDDAMLLSFLNLKLRDYYQSLSVLCEDLEADEEEIKAQMRRFGYRYSAEKNAFVPV